MSALFGGLIILIVAKPNLKDDNFLVRVMEGGWFWMCPNVWGMLIYTGWAYPTIYDGVLYFLRVVRRLVLDVPECGR